MEETWGANWADSWDVSPVVGGWNEVGASQAPASSTPQYGQVFGVLDSVTSSISKIATAAAQLRGTVNNAQLANAQSKLALQQQSAGIDIAKIQAAGSVDVERLRTQAAIASAQRALNDAQGTTIFQQIPGQGRDWLMLALAAAGVWFAWKASR